MIITRRYEWDMAHRLPLHEGKCFRLHGHRYVAEIDVTGVVDDKTGMVMDFSVISQKIEETIGYWDHRCMLYQKDNLGIVFTETGQYGNKERLPIADPEAMLGVFRVPFMPTAENISRELFRRLQERGLNIARVRVYETPDGWAETTGGL